MAFHAEDQERGEAAAQKTRAAGRWKWPLVLTGLIVTACICVLTVVVMMRESPDLLAGTSWLSGDDASQWVFGEDGTFHWYQTKGETDDNYFAGTYEFQIGRDAIRYLTNELSGYGVTEQELQAVIRRRTEYTQDNFACFSTTNQSFMLNGQEQLSGEVVTSYFGFLLSEGTYLDIANMTTGAYYSFTREQAP